MKAFFYPLQVVVTVVLTFYFAHLHKLKIVVIILIYCCLFIPFVNSLIYSFRNKVVDPDVK